MGQRLLASGIIHVAGAAESGTAHWHPNTNAPERHPFRDSPCDAHGPQGRLRFAKTNFQLTGVLTGCGVKPDYVAH